MNIWIEGKDIAKMDTDCVVNAANSGLREGIGVCGTIFEAAGRDDLREACGKIGGCPTGSAVVTPGFGLKARYIIHAVGPVWSGTDEDRKLLRSCYIESLERARENGCHSIAFPIISAGVFGCPKEEAWAQAVKGCIEWEEQHSDYEMNVVFAVRKASMREQGEAVLSRYMDNNWAGQVNGKYIPRIIDNDCGE